MAFTVESVPLSRRPPINFTSSIGRLLHNNTTLVTSSRRRLQTYCPSSSSLQNKPRNHRHHSAIVRAEEGKFSTNTAIFDIEKYIVEKSNAVNDALDKAVAIQEPVKLHQAMRYALLCGGKRIRPVLCMAACELVGGHDLQAIPGACSLEMLHTMTLIQDDLPCMDNHDLRRGKSTTHKVFGEGVAVLASNSLHALATLHIVTAAVHHVSSDRVLAALNEFWSASDKVIFGQAADILSTGGGTVGEHHDGSPLLMENLEFIHANKTGALFEVAAVMGGIFGGGDEEQVEKLRGYGRRVGLMFQTLDDVLDMTMSSADLGKTAGKDLVTDKLTFPKLMGLEKSMEFSEKLRTEANEMLMNSFDAEKSKPLIALADYIASRKS